MRDRLKGVERGEMGRKRKESFQYGYVEEWSGQEIFLLSTQKCVHARTI